MTRPIVPAASEIWYDELVVTQPGDEDRGWPLLILLGAMGYAFGDLHDLVRDTDDGPGWSILLDPDRCPVQYLPWLAQFAGVVLPPGLPEAEQRRRISNPAPFTRGSTDAIKEAGAVTLTGTKTVRLLERVGGDEYAITAVTRTSETTDATATFNALLAATPAWLLLTHVVSDAPIIDEWTDTIDSVTATIDAMTLADVV